MGHAEVYNSHPNDHSKGGRTCKVCGNHWGLIRKYQLNVCRQCFREYAKDIGFIKYR
jgi:small subunit ribosomal protein S29e